MGYAGRRCWLCSRNGMSDPLDKHHIFGGALRSKSERHGLYVYLCHDSCHLFGERAVHQNRETMQILKEHGQMVAMKRNGWDTDDFRREFGKNYLDEPGMMVLDAPECDRFSFELTEEAPLPY